MNIIRIALPLPLMHLFDYLAREDEPMPSIGARLKVPCGNRVVVGIVVGYAKESSIPKAKLKLVGKVIDREPLFPPALWEVLCWAADYYHCPLGEVLQQALPQQLRQGSSILQECQITWQATEIGKLTKPSDLANAPRQQEILSLLQQREISSETLIGQNGKRATLQALQAKGLVEICRRMAEFKRWQAAPLPHRALPQLNSEQSAALEAITPHLSGFGAWLLQGVTGSGKTEVYLRLLEQVLASGKQALVLVPEIGLTMQTASRLESRLGVPLALLHSAISENERLKIWRQAYAGEVALILGTRSALFAPLRQLGIIIVDEEHDPSYKQQSGWRYQARDLAVMLASKAGVPILLCSATPAVESLHNVTQGKYRRLLLTKRASSTNLVKQHILDIQGQRLQAGIAPQLLARLKEHLQAGNQVMLFLNRRGYAPAMLCHDCGWVAQCQRCEHYYTIHRQSEKICCHHCGGQRPIPNQCPQCSSTALIPVGLGTERVEEELRNLLPDVSIARIDRDSTRRKGSLDEHLDNIQQGHTQLFIGTQMLAKGHHFPNVTLVALLNVDGALFSADFRATERFAQLYTQVSGRAGREEKAGEVVLQTHHPEHPVLQTLLTNGYQQFAEQTIEERQLAELPPHTHHTHLNAEDLDNQQAEKFLLALRALLHNRFPQNDRNWILGPTPAIQSKRAGHFRWQLLLRHPSRHQLQQMVKLAREAASSHPMSRKIRWSLDVDPIE